MSKIAILDTGIFPKGLNCGNFHAYSVCEEDGNQDFVTSHGTICAKVLDHFTSEYDLFGIRIMKDSGILKTKPMGDILHLKKGLELCLELDVDIVCMSSVSSILSDSSILYQTVKELSGKSIILAALDNRRYVTVPTAYPFVVGVQSDWKDCLNPGELSYNENDIFYAGLYANCNISLLEKFGCSPSNSFATPAAAAKINDWRNSEKRITEKIRNLKPYPSSGMEEEIFIKKRLNLYKEKPFVVLYASENENVYAACQASMDKLYKRYCVQSSALCSMETGADVRFRKLESFGNMKRERLFMECCYKTDMIFLIIEKMERDKAVMQVEVDLEIELRGNDISILSENGCVKSYVADMADLIYKILQ